MNLGPQIFLREYPFGLKTPGDNVLPPRSALAPIPPIGLGSGARECLSSYIQRLADVHCVTPHVLVRELVWPGLRYRVNSGADDFWQTPSINAIGRVPINWARCLTALTGRKDLYQLTLRPLSRLLPFRNLTTATHRWCPVCLKEDLVNGMSYGRLLWSLAVVKACPKHGVCLVAECGCTEKNTVPVQRRKFLPQHCHHCGQFLGNADFTKLATGTTEEIRRAALVYDLLGSDLFERGEVLFGTQCISHFLQHEVETVGNMALLARRIGISKGSFHGWVNGHHLPPLPWVVRIAETCSVSLREVLTGDGSCIPVAEEGRPLCTKRKTSWTGSSTKKEIARLKLQIALQAEPPVRLSKLCQELNIDRRVLRMMLPALVRSLL